MAKRNAPTLRAVASAAGVDVSTVSRILNSPSEEREKWAGAETVQRILACAAELGYRRNPHAASLRTARTLQVGVVVPRLQDFVLATIFEGIDDAASEHGYAAFVTNSLDDPAQRQSRIHQLLDRRVDGIILADARIEDPILRQLASDGVPFVLTSRASGPYPGAFADDEHGGYLVADHFARLGFHDVAVIAGPTFTSTANLRVDGFRTGLHEHGLTLPEHRLVRTGFDAAAGRAGVEKLLARGPVPSAIFATNDFAAIGAIGGLRDRGLRVPDDVAIVGYNDTPLAENLPVPLTTVRSPMVEMGRTAFRLLEQAMAGRKPASVALEPALIVRESTGVDDDRHRPPRSPAGAGRVSE
ncbi:substrate-binding domain-containing protein [Nocardia speluncae]|uniref:Substrate-binding domain-containing protein n=1 Tax=Nocardia speluncae TaxID=419477 RepID=A0A846XK18_9NOCA|nr:LacI family DNA-binding transcriptional regulator [Nocardia speluncae]NKY34996.1 substrate-binding domain-containing protein [Nocardia speluncae]